MKNISYFLKEAKTIFKVDLLSNLLSLFSIGLVFFILSLVIAGWWISNDFVQIIEQETEISAYYDENIDEESLQILLLDIGNIQGINEASLVNKEESYNRMVDILGQEADILEYFDENPFTPFIEVKIEIDTFETILEQLQSIEDIDFIRDNRQVIEKLHGIINILEILGVFLLAAVGISTLIIISHIIRQGIYNNREEINTLKLLGAPDRFIQIPFIIEGIFLTIVGGFLAVVLWIIAIKFGYSNIKDILPFIPMPSAHDLQWTIIIFIMIFSFLIGLLGSRFGLKSIKKQKA